MASLLGLAALAYVGLVLFVVLMFGSFEVMNRQARFEAASRALDCPKSKIVIKEDTVSKFPEARGCGRMCTIQPAGSSAGWSTSYDCWPE